MTAGGVRVAALAVVNAVGSVTVGDGPWFWAAPFEVGGEFGGRGLAVVFTPDMLRTAHQGRRRATAVENTTLAVVVTDAALTKPQAKRLAMMAQTGLARAIYPAHAPLDGDVVFAAATGEKPIDPLAGLTELGMVAANVMARAIARGVHEATALPFLGALPSWKDRFGTRADSAQSRSYTCGGEVVQSLWGSEGRRAAAHWSPVFELRQRIARRPRLCEGCR